MPDQEFVRLLRRHAIRPTAIRVALCRLFASDTPVLTAPQVLALLRQQRRVNKVTVYRNLELFCQRGLLRQLPLPGRSGYYEMTRDRAHPHFQCRGCGVVECLQPVDPQEFWQLLRGPAENLAQQLEILVAGLCRRCRQAGK